MIKDPKKILKVLSWFYIFFIIGDIAFAVLVANVPGISELYKTADQNVSNPLVVMEIMIILGALLDLLVFYLIRRYTSGKGTGLLLMIILLLNVGFGISSMITTKSFAGIGFILNLVTSVVLEYARAKDRS